MNIWQQELIMLMLQIVLFIPFIIYYVKCGDSIFDIIDRVIWLVVVPFWLIPLLQLEWI